MANKLKTHCKRNAKISTPEIDTASIRGTPYDQHCQQQLNVNVKCKSDYIEESQCEHCTYERRVRKRDKKVRRDVI